MFEQFGFFSFRFFFFRNFKREFKPWLMNVMIFKQRHSQQQRKSKRSNLPNRFICFFLWFWLFFFNWFSRVLKNVFNNWKMKDRTWKINSNTKNRIMKIDWEIFKLNVMIFLKRIEWERIERVKLTMRNISFRLGKSRKFNGSFTWKRRIGT